MALKMTGEVELAGATFRVGFLSRARRRALAEQCAPKRVGAEFDGKKFERLMGEEQIEGWSGLTPLGALELGYDEYESLPTDGNGEVPYSRTLAGTLYTECLPQLFGNHIDDLGVGLAREVARAKKRDAASSATSPAPSA